jgi:hypothetical protein
MRNPDLGPQQVARDETRELLLGNAPCISSSLIMPCTIFFSHQKPEYKEVNNIEIQHDSTNKKLRRIE